jgi:hypothetical protein
MVALALNGSRMALRKSAVTSTLGVGDIPPIAPPMAAPVFPTAFESAELDEDAVATGEAGLPEPFGEPPVGPQAASAATRVMTSTVDAVVRE